MKRGAFHAVLLAFALFAAFVFGLAPVMGNNTDTLEVALSRHVRALARDIGERSVLRGDGLRKAEDYGPGDRPETLDYAFMARLVESLELAVRELAGGE